jgi:hypothetical protein
MIVPAEEYDRNPKYYEHFPAAFKRELLFEKRK